MKKITIYTIADKRPDFIPVQYESFKKFVKDDYDYIVINNAIDSKKRRDLIRKTCEELQIKSIEVKKENRFKIIGKQKVFSITGSYRNANVGTAYPIKWAWEKMCKDENDLFVLIDSDMFLLKPTSFIEEIGKNDASFVIQYRGIENDKTSIVTYPWNGICILNHKKIPSLIDLNWDCGVIEKAYISGFSVDVGGYGHYWLKKNKVSTKHISEYAIHNYKILEDKNIWIEATLNGNFHYSFEYNQTTKEPKQLEYYTRNQWQIFKTKNILPHMPENFNLTLQKKTIKYFEEFILNKQDYPAPTFIGIIEYETFSEEIDPFIVHNKAGSGYMGFDANYAKKKLNFIEKIIGLDQIYIRKFREKIGIEKIIVPSKIFQVPKNLAKIIIKKTKIMNLKKYPQKLMSLFKKIIRKILNIKDNSLTKKQIKKMLGKENAIVFEIGSANGEDSFEILKTFKDGNFRLYGFEPEPKNIKIIKEKIQDIRFKLFEGVISDTDGEIIFNRSATKNPEDLSLSGSIMPPKNHLKVWDWIHFSERIKVSSTTLDSFCKNNNIRIIDFVWCDVQGAEEKVIIGGKEAFKNKVKYFYTEYSNNEYYEGQPNLEQILKLLPSFEIVKDFGTDILLRNKNL